jgi:2-haloacid dehalogenase
VREPATLPDGTVVRACLFDVFGTVVDWFGGVTADLAAFASARGIAGVDWAQFTLEWRGLHQPAMEEVRGGRRPWVALDVLHRESLVTLLERYGVSGLDAAAVDHINQAWHRLDPWPDAVVGLERLRVHTTIAPCSNGNRSLLEAMARRAGLPWDAVLGAELARAYKPQPEVYLTSCRELGCAPPGVLMVAAHTLDLRAAAALGLRTAFVRRARESPVPHPIDADPDPGTDVIATDFLDLATQLSC